MLRILLYTISSILCSVLFISCEKYPTISESLSLREKIDLLVEPVTVFGDPGAIIIGVI